MLLCFIFCIFVLSKLNNIMVLHSLNIKELKKGGFQPLISTYDFTIGRNDLYVLTIVQGKNVFNNFELLSIKDLSYLREILEQTNFDVFMVKDINYIFNLGNLTERHIFTLLGELGKDYSHLLDDYDFHQFEFCDNGDVIIDGCTIPTRITIYETS